ncbi:hypothetical protein [Prolixibacter denitrificans]|uniref:YopA central domain-containing protein n=1 Tax=Prolixibacter denitrificans TaxID=1541063 RepID=A0A2P8CAM4_9BACT|nr:hypothetical protein [Prolixibacter denitrificans]PSK82033.1 hypothetical protein CLV93_107147 [Prolixibacter denitrificans]GET22625.1 hypothetical protein JCM18694_28710 [Prolixibacter denitrificans]
MENKEDEFWDKTPRILTSPYMMESINKPIEIFRGSFKVQDNAMCVDVDGNLYFNWFPRREVLFEGVFSGSSIEAFKLLEKDEEIDLFIEQAYFGKASILGVRTKPDIISINGYISYDAVQGDKTIPVTSLNFVIPNLRYFNGSNTKDGTKENGQYFNSRLKFEDDDFEIFIDRFPDFEKLNRALKDSGGFISLYAGEIKKRQGDINYSELQDLLFCFQKFLTFLNGRRTAPLFIQGVYEGKVKWTDFSSRIVDPYKYVVSWPAQVSIDGLDTLWRNYRVLWKQNKDFARSIIHWYVEANMNSGYLEGAIIMTQVALELLYNWLIIEEQKLLIGRDGANITAANKIRLLLSQINLKSKCPETLEKLGLFIKENKLEDGIEAFVLIRNSIVHSQENKRKEIKNLDGDVKFEALELGLWYIEVAMLNILEFEGMYYNRCSRAMWSGEGEEPSPYLKSKS